MKHYISICATILSICASSHLFSDIILDNVMTKDEQKSMGITKLNYQQKMALEAWLNKNFILKDEAKIATTPPELSLSININNGQKLILSDNTIWEIDPDDIDIASVWITPFPVKISPSNDPQYPVLLTNTATGVSVRARKSLEGAEKTTPPPPSIPPAPAQPGK